MFRIVRNKGAQSSVCTRDSSIRRQMSGRQFPHLGRRPHAVNTASGVIGRSGSSSPSPCTVQVTSSELRRLQWHTITGTYSRTLDVAYSVRPACVATITWISGKARASGQSKRAALLRPFMSLVCLRTPKRDPVLRSSRSGGGCSTQPDKTSKVLRHHRNLTRHWITSFRLLTMDPILSCLRRITSLNFFNLLTDQNRSKGLSAMQRSTSTEGSVRPPRRPRSFPVPARSA